MNKVNEIKQTAIDFKKKDIASRKEEIIYYESIIEKCTDSEKVDDFKGLISTVKKEIEELEKELKEIKETW